MFKAVFKSIKSIISLVVLAGVGLAILSQFNGDIFEAIAWIVNAMITLIFKIADYLSNLPLFRELFQLKW